MAEEYSVGELAYRDQLIAGIYGTIDEIIKILEEKDVSPN